MQCAAEARAPLIGCEETKFGRNRTAQLAMGQYVTATAWHRLYQLFGTPVMLAIGPSLRGIPARRRGVGIKAAPLVGWVGGRPRRQTF
jgi:hypothetical protein